MLVTLSPEYLAAQSRLRVWSACGQADRGFLAVCDALSPELPSLVRLQDEAFQAAMFMSGFARGQQRPTEVSGRGVRHRAHEAGLPVGGGW